jgi:hypothetical protein
MVRIFCAALALQFLVIGSASAQQPTHWKIRGDTTGAPRGCSAAAGISAISAWFAAFTDADSAGLAKASSIPHGRFVFSIKKFGTSDTSLPTRTFEELLAYARKRARERERMTVQAVRFRGWRGRVLEWDPIYFTHSANDLGNKSLAGVGKGGYWCGQGVWYLHLAPRPESIPDLAARVGRHRLTNVASDKHFSVARSARNC